jgi:regulator of replication initiation timing
MLVHFGSQLHYRCSFELARREGAQAAWDDIVKTIRDWVSIRCGKQEELGRKWFFVGGEWRSPSMPRFRVQTTSSTGSGTDQRPQYWSLRYEHPCDDVSFRDWQTDIGLTAVGPDRYRIALTTTHSLRPGYIGDEPSTPMPSAPGIVTKLLQSVRWTGFFGGDKLTVTPVLLKPGQGQFLVERLKAKDRCPLILVTVSFASQLPRLEPSQLARVLAGTAIVYSATSSEVDKELEWILPKHLRCWNGMIRVYQPGVDVDHEPDGRRHRFFTADEIDERSAAAVQEIIVRGIVRRGRVWIGDGVATIEDVLAKQREFRLAELRAKPDGRLLDEWLEVYESDNADLRTRVKELTKRCGTLEEEKDGLEEQISSLIYEKQALKVHFEKATDRKRSGDDTDSEFSTACRAASEGEPTLTESLIVISRMYAERIVVLESAWRSARDADRFEEKAKAHKVMLAFAIKYWSMLDSDEGNAKAKQVFGDAFAGKESETVERNTRARQIRTFDYVGHQIEMMSHLKIGVKFSAARTWRMHFVWDAAKRKLVIGHCGKHLDQE